MTTAETEFVRQVDRELKTYERLSSLWEGLTEENQEDFLELVKDLTGYHGYHGLVRRWIREQKA